MLRLLESERGHLTDELDRERRRAQLMDQILQEQHALLVNNNKRVFPWPDRAPGGPPNCLRGWDVLSRIGRP